MTEVREVKNHWGFTAIKLYGAEQANCDDERSFNHLSSGLRISIWLGVDSSLRSLTMAPIILIGCFPFRAKKADTSLRHIVST